MREMRLRNRPMRLLGAIPAHRASALQRCRTQRIAKKQSFEGKEAGNYPPLLYITHLNTARNSQTKKPSVTLSAALRNLPSLFIDVTPIFLDLAGTLLGALFLLFREQPRQLVGHARDLRPPQRALQLPYLRLQRF